MSLYARCKRKHQPSTHYSLFLTLNYILLQQKRRKQAGARQELQKWKESEALNQELVVEATAKLQRPKSVDPGKQTSFICVISQLILISFIEMCVHLFLSQLR